MIAVLFVTVSIMEKGCFSSLPFFRIFSFFAYSSNLFFPLLFILLSSDFQRLYLHFLRKNNLSSNQLYINRFIKHIFLFKIPILICNSTLKYRSFHDPEISSKNSNVILTLLDIIYPYESSKSSNRFVSRYCFPKLTWTEWTGWKSRVRQVTGRTRQRWGKIDIERKRDTTTDTVENLIEVSPRSIPRGKFVASHPDWIVIQ